MSLRAGFDVGGTNARVHLFDPELSPLGGTRSRIRDISSPEKLADLLVDLLGEACREEDATLEDVEAIGVGLAAQLSGDGRVVLNAPNLGWRAVEFAQIFEAALCRKTDDQPSICLVNDLTAQLWGEYKKGALQGVDDALAVSVGTGVGGALLSGGQLLRGSGNNAGEIGHSKVVVGGRPCGCGERGCVEAYAGGVHLERRIMALMDERDDSSLDGLVGEAGVDLGEADRLSAHDDELAAIWKEATDFLAIVVANACTLLDPRALLIGGGVLDNCQRFRSSFLGKTLPLVLEVIRRDLVIEQAALGDLAAMLGAADLA